MLVVCDAVEGAFYSNHLLPLCVVRNRASITPVLSRIFIISPVLTNLINLSLSGAWFPENWKSAKVTALFKERNPTNCNNYRSISILPTVSKVIERAVHTQLYDYLKSNNILYTRQFVSRRRRSTATALVQFTKEILNNMDNGRVTGVVYLDLKKAFDTVNHSILLNKLNSIGLDSHSVKWSKSYLKIVFSKPSLQILRLLWEKYRPAYHKEVCSDPYCF